MARVKLNEAGFRAVRTDPKVMAMLTAHAQAVAAEGGKGYHPEPAEVTGGKVRGRAAVVIDRQGMRKEAERHTAAGAATTKRKSGG